MQLTENITFSSHLSMLFKIMAKTLIIIAIIIIQPQYRMLFIILYKKCIAV